MKKALRIGHIYAGTLCLALAAGLISGIDSAANAQTSPKKEAAVLHGKGTFDVKVTPQTADDKSAVVGAFSLEKQFHGDIEGSSKGQMLASMTTDKGSGGYVAMEQITAKLQGRSGTFMLQHSGTMSPGQMQLNVQVIPGSGTGEFAGIAGTMKIIITDGKHFYELDYTLPESQ